MYSRIFHIAGAALQQPVEDFVRMHHQQAHESIYSGGFIRLYEDYSFINENDLMVCIRVDATEASSGKMTIEFIAGGGRQGLINWGSSGSEQRRANKFRENLIEFCTAHQYQLTEAQKQA